MTHTPTPWVFNPNKNRIEANGEKLLVNGVSLPCGNHPRSNEATANARFIVKACNTHDELVEALKGVLHHNQALKKQYQLPDSLIGQIERALTKAEKG